MSKKASKKLMVLALLFTVIIGITGCSSDSGTSNNSGVSGSAK